MTLKGQNNENLFYINRSLIAQYLQKEQVCTRSQLSKALGLTPASITKTVAGLIESGLIREVGYIQGKKGRRSVGITLNTEICKLIGVKLSRRSFSVGVFDMRGESFGIHAETFDGEEELGNVLNKIKHEINAYMRRFGNVVAVGVAVPGPYLDRESRIVLITETNNWKEVSLKEELVDCFSIPVIISHDANAGALADWWFGPNQRDANGTLVHYLVGEGVGAGVLINGEIMRGENGIAGEIGHTTLNVHGPQCACGSKGCLELYCSSLAFRKYAEVKLAEHPESDLNRFHRLTPKIIFEVARQGDSFALSLLKRVGRYIGYGAVTIINAYDPNTIIISNEMAQGGELLLKEVLRVVKTRVASHIIKNINIELSGFPNDPILYGAAAVAIDHCLKNPELLFELKNSSGCEEEEGSKI